MAELRKQGVQDLSIRPDNAISLGVFSSAAGVQLTHVPFKGGAEFIGSLVNGDIQMAFFGTPLLSYLVALKVDSLFVTGGSTSGCVRVSVVDAFSNNIPVTLISDGCFDRYDVSHAVTLFDLGAKYAEVATGEDSIKRIRALPDGLFGAGA